MPVTMETNQPQCKVEPRLCGVAPAAPPHLLLLSNGHGEDAMGAMLAARLRDNRVAVNAFPLVGEGAAYRNAGIPVVGEQAIMPSGGFVLEGSNAIWQDIKAGLLGLTWRQIQALRAMASKYVWAVGVGDVYPLTMNAFFLHRPFTFIPTAKSDYIRGHYAWEAALMRRTCKQVFPRDAATAASLQAQGVPAQYHGNLMMDALKFSGKVFGAPGQLVVGILPGSREPEAYQNTAALLAVAEQVCSKFASAVPLFVIALAGSLSQTNLAAAVREQGWTWHAPNPEDNDLGIAGKLTHSNGKGAALVVRGRFADVLVSSQVVLGMSGTGNEQAVGLGVPVITLPGPGPQFTAHFAHDQKKLLGEAILLVENGPEAAAEVLWSLLHDPKRREAMGSVGKQRMGEPGATQRITEEILSAMYAGEAYA